MKKISYIIMIFSLALIMTGCASNSGTNKKKPSLNSCLVKKNYDFVFEIVNNTDELITFTNGINEEQARFDTIIETKPFSVQKGQTCQLNYSLALMEKLSGLKKENIHFYIFMSSDNNTVIDGNEKSICIYEKDGRYINDRFFYKRDQSHHLVLAERKYILTLTKVDEGINVYGKIEDVSDFVYDEIVPGDGKSPIKLQLRNSKEYIEVDWRYCNYHKENRGFNYEGNFSTSMTGGDWRACETGKEYGLLLNYNRNNDYYSISNRDEIRPYTVEELETLIGIKNPRTSPEGVKISK